MSRSGPDSANPPTDAEAGGCRPPLLAVLAALGLLIGALVIALDVLGVISALVFPAHPPLPDGLTTVAHERQAHGLDVWIYESAALNPCAAAAFFREAGGACVVEAGLCDDQTYNSPGHSIEQVAECQRVEPFSVFGLRWQVVIGTRYSRRAEVSDTTVLRMRREVLWGGLPPATSTPPAGVFLLP